MKITRIRPWHVTGPGADPRLGSARLSYVFVQVETDEGLTGWGEVTTYPGPVANRTIVAALREVDTFLQGDDAVADRGDLAQTVARVHLRRDARRRRRP